MRAIAYCRCSTSAQDLSRQKMQVRDFCRQRNIELVQTIEDEGVSGVSNFESLNIIQSLTSEDCDILVVSELSRLTRADAETLLLLNIVNTVIHHGIRLVFISRPEIVYETKLSLLDVITLSVESSFAATERERIRSRMETGKLSKLEGCGNMKTSNTIPYGYTSIQNEDYVPGRTPRSLIVPDPDTAPIVREIYERIDRGDTVADVTRYGNTVWFDHEVAAVSISRMLRNPFYRGERKYSGKTYPVEPIVSPELWYRVVHRLDERKGVRNNTWKRQNPLFGILFCGRCGSPMWQMDGNGYYYFGCKERVKKGPSGCSNRTYSKDTVVSMVEEIVRTTMTEEDYAAATRKSSRESNARTRTLERQVKKLEVEKERLERKSRMLADRLELHGVEVLFRETLQEIERVENEIGKTKLSLIEVSKPLPRARGEVCIQDVVERVELDMNGNEKSVTVFFRNGVVRTGIIVGRQKEVTFVLDLEEEE